MSDAGVVLEHAGVRPGGAVAGHPEQLRSAQVHVDEQPGGVDGGVDVPLLPQQRPGLRERRDRQPVPGGDHLVVPRGPGPGGAGREQPGPDARPALGVVGVLPQLQGRGALLERAGGGHRQQRGRPGAVVRAEHGVELGGRPDVEEALLALGVGVEGGREPALRGAQLAEQEVGRLARDALAERVAGLPPPAHVEAEQLGVVVEHLLEVRHHPAGVDGVAGEAAGELVVHAAPGHRVAGLVDHLPRLRRAGPGRVPEQELQHHRRRELGGAAEPAVLRVELPRPGWPPRRRARPRRSAPHRPA